MAAPRREARERALTLLYESDIKGETPSEVLAALTVLPDDFTVDLVTNVGAHIGRIDELVAGASVGWELDRMPVVDRTILRLAVAELLTDTEMPVAVVIDEAVELAKRFSTEESGSFVNGVLSTVARQVRSHP
jgi:transcription antitermination protein NusB